VDALHVVLALGVAICLHDQKEKARLTQNGIRLVSLLALALALLALLRGVTRAGSAAPTQVFSPLPRPSK